MNKKDPTFISRSFLNFQQWLRKRWQTSTLHFVRFCSTKLIFYSPSQRRPCWVLMCKNWKDPERCNLLKTNIFFKGKKSNLSNSFFLWIQIFTIFQSVQSTQGLMPFLYVRRKKLRREERKLKWEKFVRFFVSRSFFSEKQFIQYKSGGPTILKQQALSSIKYLQFDNISGCWIKDNCYHFEVKHGLFYLP